MAATTHRGPSGSRANPAGPSQALQGLAQGTLCILLAFIADASASAGLSSTNLCILAMLSMQVSAYKHRQVSDRLICMYLKSSR